MGISTGRQSTEDDNSYQCQTTGGLEFRRALERSHHSNQSAKAKPSHRKNDQHDEDQEEETVTRLTLKIR